MELDQNKIQDIAKFLKAEKIMVRQKIELLLYVNEKDDDFDEKLDFLKGMFKNVTFKVVEKGELSDVKNIVSGEIGINGAS